MEGNSLALLKRFITNEQLNIQELKQLKGWIENHENQFTLNNWIQTQWDIASNIESELTFKKLITKINEQYYSKKTKNFMDSEILKKFQKIAALLILPLIIVSVYFIFFNKNLQVQYTETIVPKGQKSEIVLPDNTHIWLNSASHLRYPSQFGRSNREVFLDGEAYFEVTKNKHKPFIVHTSDVAVKVLGTNFNVKAYSDDKEIETALFAGHVNLIFRSSNGETNEMEMKPGDLFNYSKLNKSVSKSGFKTDETIGWKINRLIFRDDTFDNLVKKIERWYNVEIIYDKTLFKDQRLTVELLEGESLERLFQIIERAINVNYRIDKQKIYIKQQKRRS